MSEVVLLRCPCPDADSADAVATALVEAKLAAAVSISAPVTSVYHWAGRIEREPEYVLIVTSVTDRTAAICAMIRQTHPYDVPAITWSVRQADADTLDWASQTTGS